MHCGCQSSRARGVQFKVIVFVVCDHQRAKGPSQWANCFPGLAAPSEAAVTYLSASCLPARHGVGILQTVACVGECGIHPHEAAASLFERAIASHLTLATEGARACLPFPGTHRYHTAHNTTSSRSLSLSRCAQPPATATAATSPIARSQRALLCCPPHHLKPHQQHGQPGRDGQAD